MGGGAVRKERMNSKERVLTAVRHQEPDRVPVDFWWSHEILHRLLNHLGLDNQEQLQTYLGSDIRCVYPRYVGPRLRRFEDGSYEDFWGVIRQPRTFSGEGFEGEYSEPVYYPLQHARSPRDLERVRWPSADWFDYDSLAAHCDRYPEHAVMLGRMGVESQTIFIQLWFFRGLEQALIDLEENPELVQAMIDRIMEFRTEHIRRMLKAARGRADILQIADDYGSQNGLMMNPATWRRFFAPPLKTIADLAHESGMKVFLHCDGSSRAILPELIQLGIDILNPVQPQCAGMDPRELKEAFGSQLCFHGAIDTQSTLPFGKKEDVIAEVRERIEVLGKGGGYILAPVHTVEADVPLENILAVYDAARMFGRYDSRSSH
ncbi:MAG: uroporphyrinogen-III decarboxylase-like protein [Acidobacteria bacterium]|nr:uroporphyrinogen-III decarboxylase-like protein [Acidobacteriota bacterium]